jgi:lia operon protein LiaF
MAGQSAKNNLFWGLLLILFGFLFMLDNFHIMDFGDFIRTFWPVILIIIGVKIILDKKRSEPMDDFDNAGDSTAANHKSSSTLSESNVFGDIKIISDTKNFTGGSISNVFGDVRVDVSKISLASNEVKLYVNGVFGDITVILPDKISYRVKASAVAGDLNVFGNKREGIVPSLEHSEENYDSATSKLFLNTTIVFGSVKILSE